MKIQAKDSAENQLGYGLIEVLIAIAVLAGLALLISQMIPQQQKSVFKTTDRAECQNRLENILSGIKKYDNQIQSSSWLPGNGRADNLDPRLNATIPWAATRITKNLMGNFASPVYTAGTILVPEANVKKFDYTLAIPGHPDGLDSALLTDYNPQELDIVQYGNMWQLTQNAATLLYPYYKTQKTCGNGTMDITTGFLGEIIGKTQLNGEQISIVIDRINLKDGSVLPCDTTWEPLPLNSNPASLFSAPVQPLASINNQIGYKVTATVQYTDRSANQQLGCEGNTTVSPGAYLNPTTTAPSTRLQDRLQLTRFGTTGSAFPLPQDWISCDPQAGTIGWKIGPACIGSNCESSIAYLCRLDYMGRKSGTQPPTPLTFPIRSTGWFICSLPPAGLDARSNGATTTLTASNTTDTNNANATQLMLGGTIYEGQYRLHLMGIDRGRNVAVKASNIYIDTNAPTIADILPPDEIHAMGTNRFPQYGHLGVQTIPDGTGGNTNNVWNPLTGAFNAIAAPHQNLFQCQSSAGAWTITYAAGNDLNIAPNNNYGLAYGIPTATLNPACGNISGYTVAGSGEYKVTAIACDACNHTGTTMSKQWYADLENVKPNPLTHSNVLYRGQAAQQAMSFTRTSTLKTIPTMPVAHSCEVYNGANPQWAASLVGLAGMAANASSCFQSQWQNTFANSCTSDTSITDDQCFVAIDGCGRYTATPFNTDYQVRGATISPPASRDCCSATASYGNSPSCSDGLGGVSAPTQFFCSTGSLTTGNPFCARPNEIQWTGVRTSPNYTLDTCPNGDQTCNCWKDSECYNNMMPNSNASCGSTNVTCEGPYTGATCPAGYIMNNISLNNAKILYTNATANPPISEGDSCIVSGAVTCSLSGGPAINPTPSPIPANAITGGVVKYNIATNYCKLPTSAAIAAPGCTSNRCPVMIHACVNNPPPTPTPATCTAPKEPCIAGDPRWNNCAGVPLCGDPNCPGDPATYQWSAPPFDAATLAACAGSAGITPASCTPPKNFYSLPQVVTRAAPGVQCMQGGAPAVNSACCTGPRPLDTNTCNLNSCLAPGACPTGAKWFYTGWEATCGYPGQNPATSPGMCNGWSYGANFCCDPMYKSRLGDCMTSDGITPLPESCCPRRDRQRCGCTEWACTPAGGHPGIQCR